MVEHAVLGEEVRITCPATTNGMNSGQRYSQRSRATARGFSPRVR